jgi:transposase-like protein
MRGPKPLYRIQLASEQAQHLRQLVRAHTTPQSTSFRARIVLAAHDHPDWSNQQIAQHAGTADRIVRKWRRRWIETQSLDDAPRPGAPRRFSP